MARPKLLSEKMLKQTNKQTNTKVKKTNKHLVKN